MKLAQQANQMETNVETESLDFDIGDVAKIIGMLRNFLYQHKGRTGAQEYMSNGRDANREAKSSKRIIVTVPNHLSPVFKVRDFGPGITPHRMANVFTQYGRSTKIGTNSQTGGFGIGAKSAWAYTDSFTIVSITGGKKRTYVAHTGSNSQGRLEMINCEDTTEETGVEISYAIKPNDIADFKNYIFRACYFWSDGEYPEFKGILPQDMPKRTRGVRLGALEILSQNEIPHYLGLDTSYYNDYASLIIDGIPYKTDKEFIKSCEELQPMLKKIKGQVLIHVGNGIMSIPANRESLDTSDLNKEIINNLADKLHAELAKHIESKFKSAQTTEEWLKTYREMSKSYVVDDHSKRGDYQIKDGRIHSPLFKKLRMLNVDTGYGRRRSSSSINRGPTDAICMEHLNDVFFLDNADEFIVTQNLRVKEYISKRAISGGRAQVTLFIATELLVTTVPPMPAQIKDKNGQWIQPPTPPPTTSVVTTLKESEKVLKKIVSDLGGKPLSTLPYTPTPRRQRGQAVRGNEDFTVHLHGEYRKHPKVRNLDGVRKEKKQYIYAKFSDHDKYHNEFCDMENFMQYMGIELCYISPQTIRAVEGEPLFQHYDEWKKAFKITDKIIASVCADESTNGNAMKLLGCATAKIKDKTLAKMVKTYEPILSNKINNIPKTLKALVSKEVKEFKDDDAELTNLIKTSYPLIRVIAAATSRYNEEDANELVFYINAKI